MRYTYATLLLALAMVALPLLATCAEDKENAARSLLTADKADKAGHGGSGHWDMIDHGNHQHMMWHDTSYGGWGRKLMSAAGVTKTESVDKADKVQHNGYDAYGHGGNGHWDMIDHGNHQHMVWHDTSYSGGWGRKLMAAAGVTKTESVDKADKAQHDGYDAYGHGGNGHWDMIDHGNHQHMVWHDTSYSGGWGRKLMGHKKA